MGDKDTYLLYERYNYDTQPKHFCYMNLMPIIHSRHAFRYLTVTTDIFNRDTFCYVNFIPVNTEQTYTFCCMNLILTIHNRQAFCYINFIPIIYNRHAFHTKFIYVTHNQHIFCYMNFVSLKHNRHTLYELYTRYIHDRYTSTMWIYIYNAHQTPESFII